MNKTIIKKILGAAVRAPSGDNVQPWEFKVSENFTRIDLYNLPEKDNSYYNYNQSASYIAHGAVIENIAIASTHLGYKAEVNLFPDDSELNLVASINLIQGEAQENPLYNAIFERYTNRFQYKRTEISKNVMDKLSDSVKNIDTAGVSLVYQQDRINKLAKELMVNDRIVFECKEIHRFLFDKIRWNKKQIEETRDGMPVDVLGLSLVEKFSFPLMRFWWYVKIANFLGLSRIIGLKSWWGCKNASVLGMITIQGNDKKSFVEGGRAVQRLWLEATLQGFALQPIIGLPLLINRLREEGLSGFSTKHKQFVGRAAETLPDLFNVSKDEMLVMGFRVGMGKGRDKMTGTLRNVGIKDL